MSGIATAAPARQPEPFVLGAPRRDIAVAGIIAVVTIAAFAAVANRAALGHIQHVDDFWLRLMTWGRLAPVTAIAKFFNILGLVYVTVPVRIAVAGYLASRRRWWHLASFAAAIVSSEILIGPLKAAYDRARPPGSLVATTAASFPSGHAVAASVTALAAAIALVPAGNRRIGWGAAAAFFALMMALSRAYLGAHWLSDALAGLLLGSSCAMLAASATDLAQRSWRSRHPPGAPRVAQVAATSATGPGDHD
jgi:membrane-associated phospholipid phosphatase